MCPARLVITICILDLKNRFRDEPLDNYVVSGEDISLPCVPPDGFPLPEVIWIKDGRRIDFDAETRYDCNLGFNLGSTCLYFSMDQINFLLIYQCINLSNH